MLTRTRWRHVSGAELPEVISRLASWPAGGAVRHMFPLATIDERGPAVVRVAESDAGWAACVIVSGNILVPCGDPEVIEHAGLPLRRWRLLVGDAGAADALLERWGRDPGTVVHVQRYQAVVPERVPDATVVPDPGLRLAAAADVPALAELAVQLHRDDRYGPDPGRPGLRAYRTRMESSVARGSVWVVGDPGDPLLKIERAVDSARWGTQLSGIVVRPDARGRGLGTAAVTTAVRAALRDRPGTPVALHVRAANEPALATYARAGFADREEWRLAMRT